MNILSDRIWKTILLVGFCICVPNLSGSVITSGFIDLPSFDSSATFSLSGSGFAVGGFFAGPPLTPWLVISDCQPCSPGDSLPVSGIVVGNDFGPPWGDLDAAGPSVFTVTGIPIILSGPGTYTSSFSFTGSLCGTSTAGPAPDPCTVNLPVLTGSGQVSVTIVQFPDFLESVSATYTFTTPEPSTVVLTAIAALIFLTRRQKLNAPLV